MREAKKRQMREVAEDRNRAAKQKERIEIHRARMQASADRARYFRSEIAKLNMMTCEERLTWLVEVRIPIHVVPVDYFDIDYVVTNYSGEPALELISNCLKGHKKHWALLVSELEKSRGGALE